MPRRFFIGTPVEDREVTLDSRVADHVARSLRMRPGDRIVVVDPGAMEHGLVLREVGPGRVTAERLWSRAVTGEPRLAVSVVQALPRQRMEDCVDALVEVGAAAIHPVITEHVVSRPGGERLPRRVARWQAIAVESAELAGRGVVPTVHTPVDLATALASLPDNCRVVACTFDGSSPLSRLDIDAALPLALCIGPEGGFGEADLRVLDAAAVEAAHLGARVLRTRLAGAIACGLVLAAAGDLDRRISPEPST